MDFDTRGKNRYYKLTETEIDLFDYISEHKTEIVSKKIVTLADEFYIVPNTITRFCRKLGYDGFSDLKLNLKLELEEDTKQASNSKSIIYKNLEIIDHDLEVKISQVMEEAQSIYFYGYDQTGITTKVAVKEFSALDDKIHYIDWESDFFKVIENHPKALFFIVSLSGKNYETLKNAEYAHQKGHTIISLTNLTDNRLAEIADYNLYCYSETEILNAYDVTFKAPILLVLRSLFETYCVTHNKNK